MADYRSSGETQLSVKAGDIVKVVTKDETSGVHKPKLMV